MLELRSSIVAVALLCVAACADLSGDDRPHRDCFRKAVEKAMEPNAARPAKKKAAAAPAPAPVIDAGCSCEPEPPEWDGTGRAEAVRGT
jgi:hypothetical protein